MVKHSPNAPKAPPAPTHSLASHEVQLSADAARVKTASQNICQALSSNQPENQKREAFQKNAQIYASASAAMKPADLAALHTNDSNRIRTSSPHQLVSMRNELQMELGTIEMSRTKAMPQGLREGQKINLNKNLATREQNIRESLDLIDSSALPAQASPSARKPSQSNPPTISHQPPSRSVPGRQPQRPAADLNSTTSALALAKQPPQGSRVVVPPRSEQPPRAGGSGLGGGLGGGPRGPRGPEGGGPSNRPAVQASRGDTLRNQALRNDGPSSPTQKRWSGPEIDLPENRWPKQTAKQNVEQPKYRNGAERLEGKLDDRSMSPAEKKFWSDFKMQQVNGAPDDMLTQTNLKQESLDGANRKFEGQETRYGRKTFGDIRKHLSSEYRGARREAGEAQSEFDRANGRLEQEMSKREAWLQSEKGQSWLKGANARMEREQEAVSRQVQQNLARPGIEHSVGRPVERREDPLFNRPAAQEVKPTVQAGGEQERGGFGSASFEPLMPGHSDREQDRSAGAGQNIENADGLKRKSWGDTDDLLGPSPVVSREFQNPRTEIYEVDEASRQQQMHYGDSLQASTFDSHEMRQTDLKGNSAFANELARRSRDGEDMNTLIHEGREHGLFDEKAKLDFTDAEDFQNKTSALGRRYEAQAELEQSVYDHHMAQKQKENLWEDQTYRAYQHYGWANREDLTPMQMQAKQEIEEKLVAINDNIRMTGNEVNLQAERWDMMSEAAPDMYAKLRDRENVPQFEKSDDLELAYAEEYRREMRMEKYANQANMESMAASERMGNVHKDFDQGDANSEKSFNRWEMAA